MYGDSSPESGDSSPESISKCKTRRREEKRSHRSGYMHSLKQEQYDTILGFVKGTFNVPVKERTKEQNNARIRYYRNKKHFSVGGEKLFYRGKEVLVKGNASNVVKKQFNLNCGSGSRPVSIQLNDTYANLSEATIKRCLAKSKNHQRLYAKFRSQCLPVPVTAKAVNERWQMDLIDMNRISVRFDGKVYKWIFSVIDVFSRFLILRPLTNKTSNNVKRELSKIIADHGKPKIIQCDQGNEFKGSVSALMRRRGIKCIHSRPYHPQSQGKCEVSHVGVRRKILFKMQRKAGFNWAGNLHEIQETINNVPKEVIGNQAPVDVLYQRTSRPVIKRALEATLRCSKRMLKHHSRKKENSIYRVGEKVLVRFPQSSTKNRVPRRRFVLEGTVEKRKVLSGLYLVTFTTPETKRKSEWFKVDDITSITAAKEAKRRCKSKVLYKRLHRTQLHREKYLIPKTHQDRVQELVQENAVIRILLDPREDVGSCQFASMADQLRTLSLHRSPMQLRYEAVQHISSFSAEYSPFVEGNVRRYLDVMKKPSTYGDHITLQALSREYNIQILVLSTQGPEHTSLISNTGTYEEDLPLLTLGYFPEGQGEHYVSIAVPDDVLRQHLQNFKSQRPVLTDNVLQTFQNPESSDDTQDILGPESPNDAQGIQGRESPDDAQQDILGPESPDDAQQDILGPQSPDNAQDIQRPESPDDAQDIQGRESPDDAQQDILGPESPDDAQQDILGPQSPDNAQDIQRPESPDVAQDIQGPESPNDAQDIQRPESPDDAQQDIQVTESPDDEQDIQGPESPDDAQQDILGPESPYDAQDIQGPESPDDEQQNNQGLESPDDAQGFHGPESPGDVQHDFRYLSPGDDGEFCPREIQRQIIMICLENDPSCRFTLQCVSRFFMYVVQEVPLPMFHISQQVLNGIDATPYPVSVRRLYRATGRGSELAIELRRIINNPRWWNAWLFLHQDFFRNFEIRRIWYRRRN